MRYIAPMLITIHQAFTAVRENGMKTGRPIDNFQPSVPVAYEADE